MVRQICVVGLGYVGLPLALLLAKKNEVVGFDINQKRIEQLRSGLDIREDVSSEELVSSKLIFSYDPKVISSSDFIIVAVPTPIDKLTNPDMSYVKKASKLVGKNLTKGSIVVFESTVYPGVTEEVCAPLLEEFSGLKLGEDFKVGYSPERVNPGDKEHTTDKIIKVVSGMDDESLEIIANVYSSVISAGVFKAKSIKVAEAAKVIENIQRDLNIALMNELSLIFEKLGINTHDVIEAASTKWNFHKYTPGLVGGHCIGVDPYYLTYKAKQVGYNPKVILAGREINDSMPKEVASKIVKELNRLGKNIQQSKILILGLAFKENVKDVRNSKSLNLIRELKEFGVEVLAHDPLVLEEDLIEENFGLTSSKLEDIKGVDAVILTVLHDEFKNINFNSLFKDKKLLFDVKGALRKENFRDYIYLSL